MTTIKDRAMKLVMLASSPNENEARSSAYLACKLIREHGLFLSDNPGFSRGPEFDHSERTIRAKYAGKCCTCFGPIDIGDRIVLSDRIKNRHVDCAEGERP